MTIEQEARNDEITIYTWAIPRTYVLKGEDKYIIFHSLTDNKPYGEGAFLLTSYTVSVQVPAIEDAAPYMIASLEEDIVKESDRHLDKIQELKEKIANLKCLEAPAE